MTDLSQTTPAPLYWEENPLLKRGVWLIMGFNLGFILPTLLIFVVLPLLAPDYAPRRAENQAPAAEATEIAYVVLPFIPSATPTLAASPTPLPTEPPTLEPTQEVALAATATTIPPTAFPTATSIPPTATPLPAPPSYALTGIKFQLQTWNNCGPANLAMGLSYYGWVGTQRDTAEFLKPETEDKNVSPEQMVAFVNEQTNLKAIYRVAGNLQLLRWLVSNNFLVIVETGYQPPGEDWLGHYRTLVGYDDSAGEFHFYDSNLGREARPMIPEAAAKFDGEWQAFNRTYIVIYPPTREVELQAFLGRDWNPNANWRYAAEVARQEAAAAPDNAFAWFNLGTASAMIGDHQTASRAFDQAISVGLPWRMLWYQFMPYEAYYQTARLDDVVALAQATLQTTPYVEEAYYYIGRVYEVRGDLAEAREQYQLALNYNPNFRPASDALARVENS